MFPYASAFEKALPYEKFLSQHGTPDQRRRWDDFRQSVQLTDSQQSLLRSFSREMHVLVLAGAWCGDCVNQCPIFDRFADVAPVIKIRYADRDATPDLATELRTCGGARVPIVVFLCEDGEFCGRYGDKTLAKFRAQAKNLTGASCSTGIAVQDDLGTQVVQDWLNEFERMQWMLRTSSRLRTKHGD